MPGAPILYRAAPIQTYNSMYCRENFLPTNSFSSIPLMCRHFCAVAYILLMSPFFIIVSKWSRSRRAEPTSRGSRACGNSSACKPPFVPAKHDIKLCRVGWHAVPGCSLVSLRQRSGGGPAEPRSFSKKPCLQERARKYPTSPLPFLFIFIGIHSRERTGRCRCYSVRVCSGL